MFPGLRGGAYIRLLSAVYMATLLIRVAFGVVLITFAAFLTTNNTVYGLLVSASPLLELVTILFIGPFIDRHGAKRILLAGLLLGCVSLVGLAFTSNLFVLGFFNGIHGVAAAAILVPTLAIIAEVAPARHRGREMGTFNFVNMFGWFLGFGLGYLMLEQFRGDLPLTFLIGGGFAFLGFLYALVNVKEGTRGIIPKDHQITFRTFGTVLREKDVLLLGLPWLIVFLFIASLISFQGRVLSGFSGYATAGWVLLVGAGFVGTQIVYGKLSDKHGRNPFILLGACGFVGLMLVVSYAYARGGDLLANALAVWPLVLVFATLTMAFPPAALAALADVAQNLPKGITMSVYTIAVSLGFIVGPPLTGVVSDLLGATGVLVLFVALSLSLLLVVLIRAFQSPGGPPRPVAGARVKP